MKHAFLIIAHDHPEELKKLIAALDDSRNDIYVHIDKNSDFDLSQFSNITQHSKLTLIPRMHVTWGGSGQVDVELALFHAAYDYGGYRYYHLLSGVDYPTKDNNYIHNYFKKHDGKNFITCVPDISRQRMRYDQYHFLQNSLIGKKRNLWKYLDFASCELQKKLGIHRRHSGDLIRYINWVSITDEIVAILIRDKDSIHKQYRWTYCCDEIFLMDIIQQYGLENTLADQGNLRYIEWVQFSKRDSSPRILTIDDLPALERPDILFARKFNLPQSESLYTALRMLNTTFLGDME